MPEPDPRTVRLVELREQLETLERYEPVHAAVLALAEELGG